MLADPHRAPTAGFMLSLADIERAPERIAELTPAQAAELMARLSVIQAPLLIRAMALVAVQEDRIVPIADAARLINRSRDWIEKRPHLSFIRRDEDGRLLGCSLIGVQEFIRNGTR